MYVEGFDKDSAVYSDLCPMTEQYSCDKPVNANENITAVKTLHWIATGNKPEESSKYRLNQVNRNHGCLEDSSVSGLVKL